MHNNLSNMADDTVNNLPHAIDDFFYIFQAIDDQCQQYLFYPPMSSQKAITRIRNAALILSLYTIHNPNNANLLFYNKTNNNYLSPKLTHKLLQSILSTLNTTNSPFTKLKIVFKLLANTNLNPHRLLRIDTINDNPMFNRL